MLYESFTIKHLVYSLYCSLRRFWRQFSPLHVIIPWDSTRNFCYKSFQSSPKFYCFERSIKPSSCDTIIFMMRSDMMNTVMLPGKNNIHLLKVGYNWTICILSICMWPLKIFSSLNIWNNQFHTLWNSLVNDTKIQSEIKKES